MPEPLRYTLLTDGSSDRVLAHPIDWLLRLHVPSVTTQGQWADLSPLQSPPAELGERCRTAVALYPCELLIVHRDAEVQAPAVRETEIRRAIASAGLNARPHVCLVPVRMTEAWLMFDQLAIRRAAGNPMGTNALHLPPANRVEDVNAKDVLHAALRAACGQSGRKLAKFRPAAAVYRLAELIDDFSPLRQIVSFQAFEAGLIRVVPSLPQS